MEFVVKNPDEIRGDEVDKIFVASMLGYEIITKQLVERYKIPLYKIDCSYSLAIAMPRILFLQNVAKQFSESQIDGSVAELGVFQGEFAKKINACFYDKKLYLFDTFEGFSERDLKNEHKEARENGSYFVDTSVDLVMSKMSYPNNVIIKKGWFPQSTQDDEDLEKERFCFVNIDADLYNPIIAGLEYFYPKMVKNGIILIHDYYSKVAYPGAKKAVDEFCRKYHLFAMPIGDNMSVFILKN